MREPLGEPGSEEEFVANVAEASHSSERMMAGSPAGNAWARKDCFVLRDPEFFLALRRGQQPTVKHWLE